MTQDEPALTEDEIKSVYSLPLHVVKGSLIDFETTGIPYETPTHEIVTLGYFSGDKLTVMQRRVRDKTPFYREVSGVLDELPRPFYSYNAGFERDILRFELDIPVSESDIVDLMLPWRTRAQWYGLKWPRLDDLISEPEEYFHAGKITGRDIPKLWHLYLSGSGNDETLKLIMEHCFSDLLREATLLLRYPYYDGPSGPV